MPLNISSDIQVTGVIIYSFGIVIYFSSWVPLLFFPKIKWSTSLLGFIAPALTPIVWMIGIGLIGNQLYFSLSYNPLVYITVSILFVIFHCWHVFMVFQRMSPEIDS